MDLPNKTEQVAAPGPKKDIKQVVAAGTISHAQRPASRRFFDFLLAESPKDLGKRIFANTVVPRMKQGFEEAANGFLAGMLWGSGSQRPMPPTVAGTVIRAGGTQYHQVAPAGTPSALAQAQQQIQHQTTSSGNYQDLLCPTQQIAESILANMYSTLNQYNVVAVADLYEMAGLKPAPSDNSYGWTNIDGARITKERDGFRLELPRPNLI